MTATGVLQDNYRNHAVNLATVALMTTVEETKAAASRRTGAMADEITGTPPAVEDPRVVAQITSAAPYSKFQDEGTGLFGPTGTRIFPVSAKALRFDWPAAGGIVYAKSVAGAPGRHFFAIPMPERWHAAVAGNAGGSADR